MSEKNPPDSNFMTKLATFIVDKVRPQRQNNANIDFFDCNYYNQNTGKVQAIKWIRYAKSDIAHSRFFSVFTVS